MTKSLFKDTVRAIRKNFSRYISLLLIITLGTAFYVGIKATSPDMLSTATAYFTEYNLMDLRLQSSIGFTESDIRAVKSMDGVLYAEGERFVDALVKVNGEAQLDIDGTQISTRAYAISPDDIAAFTSGVNDGNYINRVQLISGNYPSNANECLVDASELSTPDAFTIGSVITLENAGGEAPGELDKTEFTIVGIIRSPYYLSFERGNTDIGSGKIGTFIVIPEEAFATDYYSEVYVKVSGADAYEPFSEEYYEYIAPFADTIQKASADLIAKRIEELRPELSQQIEDSEAALVEKSRQAEEALAEIQTTIETLRELVDTGETQLKEAQAAFDAEFSASENELNSNTAAYQAALQDYQKKKEELEEKTEAYNEQYDLYSESKETYDKLYDQCNSAYTTVSNLEIALETTQNLIDAAENMLIQIGDMQAQSYSNEQIQSVITVMQATYPELYNSVKALTSSGLASEIIVSLEPYVDTEKAKLAQQQYEISEKKAVLETLKSKLEVRDAELKEAAQKLKNAEDELNNAKTALNNYAEKLQSAGYDIQSGNLELTLAKVEAEAQLNELKTQVQQAPANLEAALEKQKELEAELDDSLSYARTQLSDAKNLYNKLDDVTWNIYDRSDTPGYEGYGQAVNNIGILSNIFPIFFFLISSLVCLTTMTRLVEEDRVVIGTYKALGYSNAAILSKYFIYAFSACLLGCGIGVAAGCYVFPYAINSAYSVMYSLPALHYEIPWIQVAVGTGISLFCTAAVTTGAIFRNLRIRPAVLMRPKTPKAGKRILLEKITFIWERISFTGKVTMRNIFRNKARVSMTIIGIAGSTALLLASLGFYNSLSDILTEQYGENAITKYDFQIVFDNAQSTGNAHSAEFISARDDSRVEGLELISMKSMIGFSERTEKKTDVYVLVPEHAEELNRYITLRSRTTGENYTLDDTGAVITEMLAKKTDTGVGDTISFKDADGKTYQVTVSAIAENYTFSYIYMSSDVYESVTGSAPEFTYALGLISSGVKQTDEDNYNNIKGLLVTDFIKNEGITTVAYTSDTSESISEITNALSLVILLFFVSALVLAFVVLYNLSNINIIERTREIATLKVLGLNKKEVYSYIYRENIAVSCVGIILGLVLGKGLHYLLITFTAVDTVMYGQNIAWYSYVIAVLLICLFIFLVNLLLKRKITGIDMVLSLKSVE